MSESTHNHEGNPLLAARTLPQFSAIKPEHFEPAVREVLSEQRRALDAAESVTAPDLDWIRRLEHITN
jgi:Zn-dependent oligopeptidase